MTTLRALEMWGTHALGCWRITNHSLSDRPAQARAPPLATQAEKPLCDFWIYTLIPKTSKQLHSLKVRSYSAAAISMESEGRPHLALSELSQELGARTPGHNGHRKCGAGVSAGHPPISLHPWQPGCKARLARASDYCVHVSGRLHFYIKFTWHHYKLFSSFFMSQLKSRIDLELCVLVDLII